MRWTKDLPTVGSKTALLVGPPKDGPPPLGPRLRALADEAWARGSRELSDMLHDAARKAETEERDE